MLRKNKKILVSILILDSVIVLLHILFGKVSDFYNLDKEYNLPSFYSALKLILIGVVSFVIFSFTKKNLFRKKWQEIYSWVAFGLLFIYLGFDEFFTIHEKTIDYLKPSLLMNLDWFSNSVFYWVPLFLPFIILALILFYYFIKIILTRFHLARNFFIVGASFFALVILSEFVGGFMEGTIGYVIMTLEESFEIFGASAFLIGSFIYLEQDAT